MSHPKTGPAHVAMITGATVGIGLEFARQLAASHVDLILVARGQDRLDALAEELSRTHGIATEVLVADLADREQLGRVERRFADADRPVDTLVNNAGFGLKRPFAANPVEQEQAHLDVLVVATMRLMHAALAAMLVRGDGRIVNVSSVAGFLPRGSYGAAKAYVTRLSRWAHTEYADQGVQVMALCPGFVRTEFHERMGVGRGSVPGPLLLDADRVVREALADLEAGRSLSVPTKRYKTLLALARVVPEGSLQRLQQLGRR